MSFSKEFYQHLIHSEELNSLIENDKPLQQLESIRSNLIKLLNNNYLDSEKLKFQFDRISLINNLILEFSQERHNKLLQPHYGNFKNKKT